MDALVPSSSSYYFIGGSYKNLGKGCLLQFGANKLIFDMDKKKYYANDDVLLCRCIRIPESKIDFIKSIQKCERIYAVKMIIDSKNSYYSRQQPNKFTVNVSKNALKYYLVPRKIYAWEEGSIFEVVDKDIYECELHNGGQLVDGIPRNWIEITKENKILLMTKKRRDRVKIYNNTMGSYLRFFNRLQCTAKLDIVFVQETNAMIRQADHFSPTLSRLDTFADFQRRPKSYYKYIYQEMNSRSIHFDSNMMFNSTEVYYFDKHTAIPNQLKFIPQARKMSLHRLHRGHTLNLESMNEFSQMPVIIHAAKGKGILHLRNRHDNSTVDYALPTRTSWMLSPIQLNDNVLIILPSDTNLIVAVEHIVSEPEHILQEPFTPSEREKQFADLLHDGKSIIFTKQPTPRITFLAARFALGTDQNQHAVQVSISERGKGLIFYSKICPRACIVNMYTHRHRLYAKDLENELDSHWAHMMIESAIKGSIVVGLNVFRQLRYLRMDLSKILGIKNLEYIKVLHVPHNEQVTVDKEMGVVTDISPIDRGKKWHLDEFVQVLLRDKKKYNLLDPYVETGILERVFQKVAKVRKPDSMSKNLNQEQHKVSTSKRSIDTKGADIDIDQPEPMLIHPNPIGQNSHLSDDEGRNETKKMRKH